MPRPYPAEFRRRALALVEPGRSVSKTAADLDVTEATLYNWIKQDRIDRGELAGKTTAESMELRKANRRVRGRDPSPCTQAARSGGHSPKRIHPVIDQLFAAGFSVKQCCRVLGVSSAGYYLYRKRPLSPTKMRREWLTALIKEVHAESRGTSGARLSPCRAHQGSRHPCERQPGSDSHAQRRHRWAPGPRHDKTGQGAPDLRRPCRAPVHAL